MKTTALHSCSQHQPIAVRNALLHRAQRATEPQHDDDALDLQRVLLGQPGHRRARRPLTAKKMAAFVAFCLAVIVVGVML